MTFSIVARCPETGQFGVAISSSSPAVATRCAHVRAGVGAVATQNVTNPRLGPIALENLGAGERAHDALQAALREEAFPEFRQVLVIDIQGAVAIHSGINALGIWAAAEGTNCAAGGNMLADACVPQSMVDAFERSSGSLADRLLHALSVGRDTGGEAGPVHSAGLLVADSQPWPYVDLRVDWLDDADPIDALHKIWSIYAPQADAYVTRALNPNTAPSYGVPGDE